MADAVDTTTFVSLFHHEEKARGTVKDLVAAGIPEANIYTLEHTRDKGVNRTTLQQLHVPERDLDHLVDDIADGGILIAVAFSGDYTDRIEGIFQRNAAVKIDEALVDSGTVLNASGDPQAEPGNVAGYRTRVYRPIVEGTSLESDDRR